MTYSDIYNKKLVQIPQSEPLDFQQIPNNAGGFVYQVGKWKQLERFLILGSVGGTYYVSEKDLTLDNAKIVEECMAEDYKRTIGIISEISYSGRAYKNSPAIFALSIACLKTGNKNKFGDDCVRYAMSLLSTVCRTGTHLFEFISYIDGMRGYGRAIEKGIRNWYLDKNASELSYSLAKYQSRKGWTNHDVFRMVHLVPPGDERDYLFAWAAGKKVEQQCLTGLVLTLVKANKATTEKEILDLINNERAILEVIPTDKRTTLVWNSVAKNLGGTALIKNLGNLTKHGYFNNKSSIEYVAKKITDYGWLHKERIHPMLMLTALITYNNGQGLKGSGIWDVIREVSNALEDGLYESFNTVVPTSKRIMLGLDVSSSMGSHLGDSLVTCCQAGTVMAMTIARRETNYQLKRFNVGIEDLGFSPHTTLQDAMRKTDNINCGGTDCSLPMVHALENGLDIDSFVVITDSETWAGNIHPMIALKTYRERTGINSKLIVVGMTSTGFTIADPSDENCIDVVGFDTDTPSMIMDFIADRI